MLASGQDEGEFILDLKARHETELQTIEQTISAKYQDEFVAQLGEAIIEKESTHQAALDHVRQSLEDLHQLDLESLREVSEEELMKVSWL